MPPPPASCVSAVDTPPLKPSSEMLCDSAAGTLSGASLLAKMVVSAAKAGADASSAAKLDAIRNFTAALQAISDNRGQTDKPPRHHGPGRRTRITARLG